MHVALLTDCWKPVRNGVVHHVDLLAHHLAAQGVELTIFAPGPPGAEDGELVVRYNGFPLGSTGYHVAWPTAAALLQQVAQADVIHAHHPFVSGALAIRAGHLGGAPVVLTCHTRYDLYLDAYLPHLSLPPVRSAMRLLLREVANHCATAIAPSHGAACYVNTWGSRVPIQMIRNGVELSDFHTAGGDTSLRTRTRAELGIAPNEVVAIYVGRLSPEKRVLSLIAGFSRARQAGARCRLLLVGDGTQRQAAEALIGVLRLGDAVLCVGSQPYERIPSLLAAADLFVSASCSEVNPLTFLEAAAAGLPALGVEAAGVAEIVLDGETGLLAPAPGAVGESAAADAFAIRLLALAGNQPLREQLGSAAAVASHAWSAAKCATEVLTLYERLVRSRVL